MSGVLQTADGTPRSSPLPAWLRLTAFVLAGAAQALAIAWPWGGQPLPWLQVLSLMALVWLLDDLRAARATWLRAAGHGWAFGTAWLVGSFWWLFISMNTYGGLAAPLAAIAVLALAAALALYYAVAAAIFVRFSPESPLRAAFFFAALWTVAELVRGSWFTGFPWGAGGYAHVDGLFAGYAPWLGVYGTGAAAALFAAVVVLGWRRRRVSATVGAGRAPWAVVLVGVAVLVLPLAGRGWLDRDARFQSAGTLQVALLQGNIPQDEKFIPGSGVTTALRWYGEQLRDARAPLVVTPETAIPLLPRQLPPGYLDALVQRYGAGAGGGGGVEGRVQAALIGIPYEDARGVYSNTVLAFAPGQTQPYRYNKHHLVPFGEFIPWGFRWFTELMNIPLGDFRRGGLAQPGFDWQG